MTTLFLAEAKTGCGQLGAPQRSVQGGSSPAQQFQASYMGSRPFLDCTVFSRLAKMPGKQKWRGVYAEENAFRHLSCYAMATLAAHDPGHGVHPGLR